MKKAIAVQGLLFGDEGKGTYVDYFTKRYGATLNVRFGGGCQCAHNVITHNRTHHTFSQFASGTLSGADTYLSKYVVVDPLALVNEAIVLNDKITRYPYDCLSLDPDCVITTPYHKLANQIRERSRGTNNHGSVGVGVGETRMDQLDGVYLTAGECRDLVTTRIKLQDIKKHKMQQLAKLDNLNIELFTRFISIDPVYIADHYTNGPFNRFSLRTWDKVYPAHNTVVFEGHQGMLLDEKHGFAPYNTWTDCTFNPVVKLTQDLGVPVEYIGVIRPFVTRHGKGPLPTYDAILTDCLLPYEKHNKTHAFMGNFRFGYMDTMLLELAVRNIGVSLSSIALSNVDLQRYVGNKISVGYVHTQPLMAKDYTSILMAAKPDYVEYSPEHDLDKYIEHATNTSIKHWSYGPSSSDKFTERQDNSKVNKAKTHNG
jgi:adenylosuccinate synthase